MDRPSLSPPDSSESVSPQRVFKTEEFCDWLMPKTDLDRETMLRQLKSVARRAGYKEMHLIKWCVIRQEDNKLFVHLGWQLAQKARRREHEVFLKREDLIAAKQAARERRMRMRTVRAARCAVMRQLRTGVTLIPEPFHVEGEAPSDTGGDDDCC